MRLLPDKHKWHPKYIENPLTKLFKERQELEKKKMELETQIAVSDSLKKQLEDNALSKQEIIKLTRQLDAINSKARGTADTTHLDDLLFGGGVVTRVKTAKNDKRVMEEVPNHDVSSIQGIAAHKQWHVERYAEQLEEDTTAQSIIDRLNGKDNALSLAQGAWLEKNFGELKEKWRALHEQNEKIQKDIEKAAKRQEELKAKRPELEQALADMGHSRDLEELHSRFGNALKHISAENNEISDAIKIAKSQTDKMKAKYQETHDSIVDAYNGTLFTLKVLSRPELIEDFARKFGENGQQCVESLLQEREILNDNGERLEYGAGGMHHFNEFVGNLNGILDEQTAILNHTFETIKHQRELSNDNIALLASVKNGALQLAKTMNMKVKNEDAVAGAMIQDVGEKLNNFHNALGFLNHCIGEAQKIAKEHKFDDIAEHFTAGLVELETRLQPHQEALANIQKAIIDANEVMNAPVGNFEIIPNHTGAEQPQQQPDIQQAGRIGMLDYNPQNAE